MAAEKREFSAFPQPVVFEALLQLLVKFARRARDDNPSGNVALAILDPLCDPGRLAAFGAVGAFGRIHDLFTVGRLCNLRHCLSPDKAPRGRAPWGSQLNWGVVFGSVCPAVTKHVSWLQAAVEAKRLARSCAARNASSLLALTDFTRREGGVSPPPPGRRGRREALVWPKSLLRAYLRSFALKLLPVRPSGNQMIPILFLTSPYS